MKIGNMLEDYVQSKEPPTRSAALLAESAKRLKIPRDHLKEIVKPYTVYIQRLPVGIAGKVCNIISGIVLHNRARGPYKGGIRIAANVDLWETTELARLMTLKTALANVELGGGKSGISVDLRALYRLMLNEKRFNGTFREFERMAKYDIMDEFTDHFGWLFAKHVYIPAPDMGSSGPEMVRIYNVTRDPASVTGKPDGIEGWMPGRKEATGYGVYYATLKHMERLGRAPDCCTVALQGFGNVGSHAAAFLHEAGVKVIAVTDMTGGAYDPAGLDIPALMKHCEKAGCVDGFKAKPMTNERLFRLKCDYLIPAARGHVIHDRNAGGVRCKVLVEAANMPVTYDGMKILEGNGIDLIPDTYANAGGLIVSNLEYRQALGGAKYSREQALAYIRERFDDMYASMGPALKRGRTMAEASTDVSLQRVHQTMLQRSLL
ncbi:MAG: Glu/Leu/Phe/Val dehydrogenase [Candidatus Hydrogenedentes bacterium]|nr:Glu/Leu/Phe/Val dehydrogenase [Candidatus Hydrogenedentota bacterium]